MTRSTTGGPAYLRAAGCSLLIDTAGPRLLRIVHWGADLGDLTESDAAELVRAWTPSRVSNRLDEPQHVGVVAERSTGWTGTPGIAGHRDGMQFAPRFETTRVDFTPEQEGGGRLVVDSVDDEVELGLRVELAMTAGGLLNLSAVLTNRSPASRYSLDSLTLNVPVPPAASELLDFSGRHLKERVPQRHAFTLGTHLREGRHGRTGADAALLLAAGTPRLRIPVGSRLDRPHRLERQPRAYADRDSTGASIGGGGELLLSPVSSGFRRARSTPPRSSSPRTATISIRRPPGSTPTSAPGRGTRIRRGR